MIDARHGRANPYACEGGLSPDEVLDVIEQARARFTVAGLVIASYDPSCDADGRIAEAAMRICTAGGPPAVPPAAGRQPTSRRRNGRRSRSRPGRSVPRSR